MNRWLLSCICIVTIVLGYAWNFQDSISEELRTLRTQINDKIRVLKSVQTIHRHLKQNPTMLRTLEHSRLLEPASLKFIQSEISLLGNTLGFSRVEMDVEEEIECLYPKPIVEQKIHLKIKSPFDRNVFQLMETLLVRVPGIIIYRDLSLERVNTGDISFVEGDIILSWYHTPLNKES